MIRRASSSWRRFAIDHFARREYRLAGSVPYVSFTFDDFPRTALTEGGRILSDCGVRGTYFVSFQLLNTESVSGPIASLGDVSAVLEAGHELGCHTFGHVDGSVVSAAEFERSIEANRTALADSQLDTCFQSFAYPLNGPAVATKRVAGSRFSVCRGGGQTFNHGVIDLSLLRAYFLDGRTRGRMDEIAELLDRNARANGWLVFATHDVADRPSPYGWDRSAFAELVRRAVGSGARVLPLSHVCADVGIPSRGGPAVSAS